MSEQPKTEQTPATCEQFEYPDGPEVFARVVEHFRNLPVAYWEARIAEYAREARFQAKAERAKQPANLPARKRKPNKTKAEA